MEMSRESLQTTFGVRKDWKNMFREVCAVHLMYSPRYNHDVGHVGILQHGTRRSLIDSYFCEFLWRHRNSVATIRIILTCLFLLVIWSDPSWHLIIFAVPLQVHPLTEPTAL
ncbi:uncharacterized protein LOC106664271 [Cimex lectularius]|uniref:Uncharacterized protein n=1 Tax=Cimex lectularius TaxID=79782 RepID=A0A8I6SKM1_CIMLE|nr:uncharacterized protein LOC106664271 [Cimex lectularius]